LLKVVPERPQPYASEKCQDGHSRAGSFEYAMSDTQGFVRVGSPNGGVVH
jgi:hypothetical protein